MLMQNLQDILEDQGHIFQVTYLKSSQIHLLTIMCHFEYTNHDILLHFLNKNP